LVHLTVGSQARAASTTGVNAARDPVHLARAALLGAETERVSSPSDPASWAEAVARTDEAGLAWEAAVARYRHAEALSLIGANRTDIAVPLRAAYRYATDQRAVPLARDIESFALAHAIPLADPTPGEARPTPNRLTYLTPREREVLNHLVVGRTYVEIANELFISEKTVSAHVSNLLRKTGTTSRREVATLALRLGVDSPA
jgi:DNA-binding NarL/FixJ family response regulator